ncbi:voltage-gated sodium channel protein, putative [Bodo saltans]|uniref:Voltage-gated sodium channel protein, putative n=1 Tax=Bodo saltans TaxID=75058 RepID=A0A0S4IZQ8_BODSA|nr:voltage-gated sodium channel protein, putative [Bodo saltans]|eukprot:CUG68881.1 voltage-gated sodium channel protein, putative [Bodo saltans]
MRFPALRKQIRVLKYVIGDLMPLLLFMLVLLFLASLVGTQLFAGLYCGLDTTSPNRVDTSLCDNVPRLNFDNIGYSAVSVFVIFCGDGWRSMMVQGMQTRGDYSALYFCLCYLIGGYLMLNLFVAVMITSADMLEDEPEQTLLVRSEHVSFLDPVSVASGVFGGGASSRRSSLRGVGTTIDGAAEGDEEMATANNDDGDLVREASMEVFAMNDSLARTSRQTSAEFEQENINSSFILGSGAKAQRAARAAALLSRASSARSVTSTRDVPPLPISPKKQTSLKQSSQVHPSSKPSDVASENRHFPLMVSSFALGEGMEDLLGTPSSVEPLPRGRTRSVRFEDEKLDRLLGDSPKATPPPALLPRPSIHNDDSDDDDPLKLSIGLLKLMDSLQSSSKFEADGSPTSMSESTAQRVLDDEVEYDVINRHTDVNDLETLRKEYRDVYNKEVADLPWLRRTAGSIVKSRRFDIVYTVVVFYSMVTVALGHMTDYPDSTMSQFKEWSDLVVALLFLSEALLKILHYGVFHKKKSLLKGYFNYRWNIFDFSVMVLSLVVACVVFTQNRTFRQVANWMRLARLLRPFSLIGRHEGLKVVARSTLASVPSIRNVGLLTILVWVSFSAFGTRLFAGRFSACTDVDWGDMTYGALGTVTDEATCLAKNFTWQPADRNFDTFGSSLLTLFQVATVDNWSDIMFMGADSSGEMRQAPKPLSRVYMIPFFVVYILLTNFFLIQFFIASMCDVYFTVKAQMEDDLRSRLLQSHEVFLDPDQKAYLGMYRRALFFVKPPLHVSIEEGSIRSYLRRIVRHKTFEPIQTIIVIVHIVLESLVFADNPPLSANTLLVIDWVFTGYFCLSAGCTWFVYGTRNFLDSSRGRGSIMNNILTVAGLILEATNANEGAASLLRQMRVFRLYRIFYVTQTIQVLVDTLLYSLPSFANVFFLLFLVFYVYAAVGMQLFGRVQFTYDRVGVGQYANFDRFDKALIALLRVATFDDWTELMYSCTVQTPVCSDQLGDCAPYPLVAYIYFLSFAVVGQWIGINFFAAEIIDAFTHAEMEERYAIQEHDVARFQRLWKEIAGSGEGHMSIGQLSVFLRRLGLPLGPVFGDAQSTPEDSTSGPLSAIQNLAASFSKPQSPTASTSSGTVGATTSLKHNFKFSEVLKFMASLEIPLVNNGVLQGSTFDALMRHFYATPLPPKYEKILGRVLNSRFQTRQFIRKAAESQTRQSDVDALHAAVDFSSSVTNRSSGTYSPMRSNGGQSFWDLYHSEQQRSAHVPGQLMYSSGGETLRMAVAATILQSRWRGARIRELVRMSKQQSPSNAFGDTSGAKSFAKKQPRRMYKATSASNYDSSEVPLLREDPSEIHAPLEHSGRRMRRSSVAAYNKPQKFVSIVERLKAKHSELI